MNHEITTETQDGWDYLRGVPATLYRWSCACGKRGVWLLDHAKVEKNRERHEKWHRDGEP